MVCRYVVKEKKILTLGVGFGLSCLFEVGFRVD